MDGRHLGDRPLLLEDRLDAIDRSDGKGRNILAEVDGEIRLAIELVGRNRRPRHLGQHTAAHRDQPFAVQGALRVVDGEDAAHAAGVFIIGEVESPVFPDHTGDRPHAGNHVAPAAGRPVIGATAMPAALSRSSAS